MPAARSICANLLLLACDVDIYKALRQLHRQNQVCYQRNEGATGELKGHGQHIRRDPAPSCTLMSLPERFLSLDTVKGGAHT